MAIERAIVSGLILNAVQTRAMFTCDVVEVGGDTSPILWGAYLISIYTPILQMLAPTTSTITYEIQKWLSGQWVASAVVPFTHTGSSVAATQNNATALVMIAKALGVRKMGRKFWSGLSVSGIVGNEIGGAFIALAVSALAAYLTPFTGIGGGSITPGIKDKLGSFRPFVGGVLSSFLGSMRRRKPGVGI